MKNKVLLSALLLLLSMSCLAGCRRAEEEMDMSSLPLIDDSSLLGDDSLVDDLLPDDSALDESGNTSRNESSRFDSASNYSETTAPSSKVQITEEEAKEAALAEVTLTEDEVTDLTVSLDFSDEKAIPHYDVEFYVGQTQYSFEIDARDGSITQFETDEKG